MRFFYLISFPDWRTRHRRRILRLQQWGCAHGFGENAPLCWLWVGHIWKSSRHPGWKIQFQGPLGWPGLFHPIGTAFSSPYLQTSVLLEPSTVSMVAAAWICRRLWPILRMWGKSKALSRQLQLKHSWEVTLLFDLLSKMKISQWVSIFGIKI
jgi:hypothetical protein